MHLPTVQSECLMSMSMVMIAKQEPMAEAEVELVQRFLKLPQRTDTKESNCNSSWQKCGVTISGDTKCQARYNRVLHGANSSFIITNLVEVNNVSQGPEVSAEPPPVLLFIQSIMLRGKYKTSLLYDSGSNTSLIMRKLAKLLDLPWRLVGCWVTIATKAPTYGLHSTHGPSVTLF